MIRFAAVLSFAAVPALADMSCADYQSELDRSVAVVTEALGCPALETAPEAWANCLSFGLFSGDPTAVAFVGMIKAWEQEPAYRECFPDLVELGF